MDWYMAVLKRYAEFSGRARRREYWMFVLINFLIGCGLGVIGALVHGLSFLSWLYSLAVLVPSIAVSVRLDSADRLHRADRLPRHRRRARRQRVWAESEVVRGRGRASLNQGSGVPLIDASRISIGCAAGSRWPRSRSIFWICSVQPGFAEASRSGFVESRLSTFRWPI